MHTRFRQIQTSRPSSSISGTSGTNNSSNKLPRTNKNLKSQLYKYFHTAHTVASRLLRGKKNRSSKLPRTHTPRKSTQHSAAAANPFTNSPTSALQLFYTGNRVASWLFPEFLPARTEASWGEPNSAWRWRISLHSRGRCQHLKEKGGKRQIQSIKMLKYITHLAAP